MRIATWNVNSIRARLDRLLAWLAAVRPDVVCLQEIKSTEAQFPAAELAAAGYRSAVFGQAAYNGVAILSLAEPANVVRDMGCPADEQARLLSADVAGVRILNAYFPNGQEVGSDKFQYKLRWMAELRRHVDERLSIADHVLLCGDFNVAVDDADVAYPRQWADTVLCCPPVRQALEHIRAWGFVDVFRQHHPAGGLYSWWDYRQLAFVRNDGLRLDHLYASPPLARRCLSAEIHRDQRKGDKPSDHAPVVAEFG